MAGWKSNAGADKEELRDRGSAAPFDGKSSRRTVTIGFPPKSPSSMPLMSNAVLAAAEYLKGRARVLWLRRINFGQCLGAYVHSDGLEGPYLYRFDEHPKSYRLPTIVELAIFFYPSKGHR
jgi:hypothetical protein